MYIFGGHDGTQYRNDLLSFNFDTRRWLVLKDTSGEVPSPRDAHAAVAHDGYMYVFGGYDSRQYLNDFQRYHFETRAWERVPSSGQSPSARGGHTAAVYKDAIYVFGGCDGWNYFNDCYTYSFSKETWDTVRVTGTAPGARSAPTAVVDHRRTCLYVFGGYDGARSLNDLFRFDLESHEWALVRTVGSPPSPRGGHTAVVHAETMYVFGGKSGRSPFNDLSTFNFDTGTWSSLALSTAVPAPRCAHVCVVYDACMYVFGGYNGRRYFDDCFRLCFEAVAVTSVLSLAGDLEQMVDNEQFADIRFAVDGRVVHAHKTILFARSEYFKRMLTGGYRESADDTIAIHGVSHAVFVCVLFYLYTGKMPEDVTPLMAVDVLGAANLYGIDPLKQLCADVVSRNLHVDNVAAILEIADKYDAAPLRNTCTDFIVSNFPAVVRSDGFRDLIREDNRDLLLKVLMDVTAGPPRGEQAQQSAPVPFAHHTIPAVDDMQLED